MKSPRFPRSFGVFLFANAMALPAAAQAQGELFKPYDLHIVVHVADNRLLTDVFRKNIERELHDGFQAALGDMGRVTVTDTHPRLPDVLARGLRSLDDWKDRTDRKTHFVLIDYSGVHYEIRTRQYDGAIGRASPVVRRDRTRDRDFVAKAAALLIKQDFGVLGTVLGEPEGATKQVKIELRGGGLGDMTRWAKKGEVFALAPPDGGTREALKWSLLQVEQAPDEAARDGVCVCRFFSRYVVRSIAGYRCIKLGTVQAPLRIRWTQRMSNGRVKPLDQRLMVDIRRHGFDGEATLQRSSDLNGILETVSDGKDGVFDNVAFVRVIDGPVNPPPQVPIALYDDQPVFIEVNASKDNNALFAIQQSLWKRSVADSVQTQANLFKKLETLGADPKNRNETIMAATGGMNRAKEDRINLLKEKDELAKQAKKIRKDLKTPLEDGRLDHLKEYEQALADFITKQKEIEAVENDPQRKKWLSEIENAKLLEKEWEFGKAIKIYEGIRKNGYKEAELDKHLEKLHKLWDPRDDKHKEARYFIYSVWPMLDSAHLEEKMPAAQDAFKKCKDVHDLYSIKKMLKGTEGHADRLRKELELLHPELVIDDEKEAQQLKKVSEQIVKLGEDIQDYLKAHADDK